MTTASKLLMRGHELWHQLMSLQENVGRPLEARFRINVEQDMVLRADRDYMISYNYADGLTPPMYGIPVEIDNLVEEMELWVRVK